MIQNTCCHGLPIGIVHTGARTGFCSLIVDMLYNVDNKVGHLSLFQPNMPVAPIELMSWQCLDDQHLVCHEIVEVLLGVIWLASMVCTLTTSDISPS